MKAIFVTALLLALVFTLGACSKEEPATPAAPATPVVPAAPAAPPAPDVQEESGEVAAPVEGDANVLDSGSDALSNGAMQDFGSKVAGVACDSEKNKITFTLNNAGENTWSLAQDVGFTEVSDRKNVKIFINGFEANRGTPQYHPQTRELMFGPSKVFTDNCGGVTDVAPGESVTCTLVPVKLNIGTGSTSLKEVNEIWTDSPSVDEYIEFTC